MIHNYLIKTNKEAVLRFYNELSKQIPVEIEWKKGRKQADYESANSAIITYAGEKILEHNPYDTMFKAELAGEKERLILQVARFTNLAENPAGGMIAVQLIIYTVLILWASSVRQDMAGFLMPALVAGFVGLGIYTLGFVNNCSRGLRTVLVVLFFLCIIPTAPSSLLVIFAGKTLNKRASYKLIMR